MSYLRFDDSATGIDVTFYDVQQSGPCSPSGCANFVAATVATGLPRATPHTIKLTMDTLDGPGNDVVKVYIDGTLVKTGGSWEDYYRYDPEASAEQSPRIVKTVLFRAGGSSVPANLNNGFLIDNFSTTSSMLPCTTDCYVDATTGSDSNPGTAALPFKTIQKGVSTVAAGGTVHVADGTYVEQVVVDGKSLTIDGNGAATIIQAPNTVPTCFVVSGADRKPVVCAKDGANLTLKDATVDGAGKGNANNRFFGVAFRNAGGEISNVTIKDVRDNPFSGVQHGVAAYAYNDDNASRTIKLLDSTIVGFQKNAIAFIASATTPLALDIQRNTITGAGTTTVTAQNGIQIDGDLVTGTVKDNTITGIAYSGGSWVATAILDSYSAVNIQDNTLSSCHTCIYKIDGSGQITGNVLSVIKASGYSWGIIATDPPGARPSPYDTRVSESQSAFASVAASPEATLAVSVDNNTVTFSGTDNTSSYGIEADAGYGVDDIAFGATGNTVSGFAVGMDIYHCQSGCSSGVLTGATVNGNNFAGNTIGLRSNVSYLTVNAENNWWGSACGPADGYVVGPVDYNPWWLTPTGAAVTPAPIINGMSASDQCAQINSAASGSVINYPTNGTMPGGVVVNNNNVTINLNGSTMGAGSPAITVDADDVEINGPGTLDGTGGTPASAGVLVQAGADNFTLSKVEVKNWLDGVQVASAVTSLKIVNNFIHDNTDAGLQVDAAVSGVATVEGNLFKANGGNGIESAVALEAEYNSFGHRGGPASGDGVSATVDADPWTFAETYIDMDPTTAGDQTTRNLTQTVPSWQAFDVEVRAEAVNVYGLTFKVDYAAAELTFNGITWAPGLPGTCYALTGLSAGQIGYTCNWMSAWTTPTTGAIAKLNFTPTGAGLSLAGPWSTSLDVDSGISAAGTNSGAEVYLNNVKLATSEVNARDITDANDGTITVTPIAAYTGFIDVQGRADDSGAVLNVYSTNGLVAPALATTSSAKGGGYTTPSGSMLVVGWTYYFAVDKPLYVKTLATPAASVPNRQLSTAALTSLGQLVLKGGDADNLESVDIVDATCIGGDYGTLTDWGCGTNGGNSDVNGDGKIDILDLTLMGGNFGITSSTWAP
jgi:hypothetical protein